MAEDFLLQGILGALEGFKSVYVPFKTAQLEQGLALEKKKQELVLEEPFRQREFERKEFVRPEELGGPLTEALGGAPSIPTRGFRESILSPTVSLQNQKLRQARLERQFDLLHPSTSITKGQPINVTAHRMAIAEMKATYSDIDLISLSISDKQKILDELYLKNLQDLGVQTPPTRTIPKPTTKPEKKDVLGSIFEGLK